MIRKLVVFAYIAFSSIQAVGSPLFAYSTDIRLMSNIQRLGEIENGFEVFAWQWNEEALSLDVRFRNSHVSNSFAPIGFIAQEVQKVYPDAVTEDEYGYLRIDGEALALKDQFIRWKLTNTSMTLDGRCVKVGPTRFVLCF